MKPKISQMNYLSQNSSILIRSWFIIVMILFVFFEACEDKSTQIVLLGGPEGSDYQEFASELSKLLNSKFKDIEISLKTSGGSVENFTKVAQDKMTMALVSAETAYYESQKTSNNKAVAIVRLFGVAAQLVVAKDSPIKTPYDLTERRISIGNPGSVSAFFAKRFFKEMNIWERIIPIYVSSEMGLDELQKGSVDAVLLVATFPSESITETNRTFPIRLIDLFDVAVSSGFFKAYPYYSIVQIPPGTYKGQKWPITTLQESTLWVANQELDEDFVYRALKILFSDKGLERMRSMLPAASDLDVKKGLKGIKISMHPAAVRFLRQEL